MERTVEEPAVPCQRPVRKDRCARFRCAPAQGCRSDLKTGGPLLLRPSGDDEQTERLQSGEGPLHVLLRVVEVRREAEAAGGSTYDAVLVVHAGEDLATEFGGHLDDGRARRERVLHRGDQRDARSLR